MIATSISSIQSTTILKAYSNFIDMILTHWKIVYHFQTKIKLN